MICWISLPGQTDLIFGPMNSPSQQPTTIKTSDQNQTPAIPQPKTPLTMLGPFCPSKNHDFLQHGKIYHGRCDEHIHSTVSAFSSPSLCHGHILRHQCDRAAPCCRNTHTVFVCQAAGKLFAMAACVVLEVGGTGGASQHSGAKQPGALGPWKGRQGVSNTYPLHAATEKQG